VLSGTVPACLYVKQAAERFRRDLAEGKWIFHPELYERVIRFCELLPVTSGLAEKKIKFLPWEHFATAAMYGFTDQTGARRFRQATVFLPRGNGKSGWASCLGLYHLCADGERSAQVYSAAVAQDQAKIIWSAAEQIVRQTPSLATYYGITSTNNNSSCKIKLQDGSIFVPLSSNSKTMLGLNVSFACLDEIASHATPEVYQSVLTATAKRRHPMLLNISTATGNQEGIGKELFDYAVRILSQDINDDRHFALLYGIDQGDDPWAAATHIKANPSWGVTVDPIGFQAIAHQAKQSPAHEAAFLTMHLNQWVQTNAALFSVSTLRENCASDIKLEDFAGQDCYVGLDLAYRLDMCGLGLTFPKWQNGKLHYYCFTKAYVNQAAVDRGWNQKYHAWVQSGLIDLTAGDVTDFDHIMDDLLEIHSNYHVMDICIDRAHAGSVMHLAQRAGLEVLIIPNNAMTMTSPTKEFEAAITEGRFHYPREDEVFEFNVSCVIGHYDNRGTVLPQKNKRNKADKIDLFMAVLFGITKAMEMVDDDMSTYAVQPLTSGPKPSKPIIQVQSVIPAKTGSLIPFNPLLPYRSDGRHF
jgi:phage terminase large subunit-like protein